MKEYQKAYLYYQQNLEIVQDLELAEMAIPTLLTIGRFLIAPDLELDEFAQRNGFSLSASVLACHSLGAVAGWLSTSQSQLDIMDKVFYEQLSVAVKKCMDEPTYNKTSAEGQELSLEQIVAQIKAFFEILKNHPTLVGPGVETTPL